MNLPDDQYNRYDKAYDGTKGCKTIPRNFLLLLPKCLDEPENLLRA